MFARQADIVDISVSSLAAGSQLGPYQVHGLIGRGGIGEVYRAHDTRLNRNVAVKVLSSKFAGDSASVARFTREARTTALLNHPNIVAVHDVGSHLGVPFVVSELLDGRTLRQQMQEGPIEIRTAVGYAVDVARGLVAAHRHGVVHRDLKPENIFITADERVKILDFGLAKCRSLSQRDDESSTATTSGIIVGTVGYASPEQLRGGAVDGRSDLFSVGVVLYEMLAGVAPYRRESAIETLHAILKEQPVPLRRRKRQIPGDLEAIVLRCLEKAPDSRFQSAQDLAFSLELSLRRSADEGSQRLTSRLASLLHLV